MKLREVLVENNQAVTERPMGLVKQGLTKLGAKVLPGSMGAKMQGTLDTGTVANKLYKDFATYLGRTGDQATDDSVRAFLQSKGADKEIDVEKIIGSNVSETVALNRGALNKIFMQVAQGLAKSSAGGSAAPAAGKSTAPASSTPSAPPGSVPSAQPGVAAAQPAGTQPGGFKKAVGQAWNAAKSAVTATQAKPAASPNAAAQPAASPNAAAQPVASPSATSAAGPGAAAQQANKSQQATQQNLNNYIKKASAQINAAGSREEKINLAKELINAMADRQGTPEYDSAMGTVKQIVKSVDPKFAQGALANLASGKTMGITPKGVNPAAKPASVAPSATPAKPAAATKPYAPFKPAGSTKKPMKLARESYMFVRAVLENTGLTLSDVGYRVAVTESTSASVILIKR